MGDVSFLRENEDSEYVGDDSFLLGNLIDTDRMVYDLKPQMNVDISLDFLLTPLIKNVIEENRDGNFQIRLYLRCHKFEYHPTGKIPKFSRDEGGIHPAGSTGLEIQRSQWADILSKAGYEKYQLVEIPIDYGEIIERGKSLSGERLIRRIKEATKHLEKIMRIMDEGRWGVAVGECRIALEALTKGEGYKTEINQVLEKSGFPDKNIKEFRKLIESLKSFTSMRHHYQEKEIIVPMGREDALFAVATLTTIINLLSRKLQKSIH